MTPREGQVTDEYDRPVQGAQIYVFNEDGTDASLTSDGLTPLLQPVETDQFGLYSYYAADGVYREDTYFGGKLRYQEMVPIGAALNVLQNADAITAAVDTTTTNANSAALSAADALSSKVSADAAKTLAQQARDDAIAAAVGADYYPGARSFVPRGMTSVAITAAGAGGTNGTYTHLPLTGDNLSADAFANVTVAGGAVTAVTVDAPGLYIGAAPTAGTVDTSSIPGLTGATLTPTIGYLKTSGQYYYTDHATDPNQVALFQNQSNAAVEVDGSVDWLNVAAAANSAALAQSYASQPKYGGKINAWPDPFFRHSSIGVNFLGRKRWFSQVAGGTDYSSISLVANPKYDGFALRKTGSGVGSLAGPEIRLDEIGAVAGDTITVSVLVVGPTGRTAKCRLTWHSATGGGGLGTAEMVNDAAGASVALDPTTAKRLHYTGVVPANAVAVNVTPYSMDIAVGETFDTVALWGYKGADIAGPSIPDFLGDDAYMALFDSTREYTGGLEQLFDVTSVINGYLIQNTDGKIVANANSDLVIIPLPDIPAGSRITISGLPLPSSAARVYAFYSSKPSAFDGAGTAAAKISGSSINATLSGGTLTVPSGAKYLGVTVRQQTVAAGDFSNVVIRVGATAATGPVAFTKHVARVDSVPPQNVTPKPPYSGGVLMLFGDSITATNNVDAASYVYPDGFSTNWPDTVIPRLMPDAAYSFARAGAEYAANVSLVNMQKFVTYDGVNGWMGQVGAAIAYAAANSITPRTIIIAMGTNDLAANSGALGDFNTAWGKSLTFDGSGVPTTTLDQTLSLENMRLGIMRLRWSFPNAIFLASMPIQRVGISVPTMQSWVATLAQMAEACGCTVIKSFAETGILTQFENNGSAGRDLLDGIHPNSTTGRSKLAGVILSRTINRLMGDSSLL